ncbi:MAG: nucleotidyltransferase family protein [Gammaproteobacteria bacterium]|nr:nucleotidyltransferase family protein [Gammaproteobacteria bacterium]
MRALILAAGRGERMRPLTIDMPKPLLRAGGKPLIDWHIEALARAGITELVVNLSWQGEKLREYLGDGSRHGVSLQFSEEGPEPLETGGGIHHALRLLGPEPFWVVNGDISCDFSFAARGLPAGMLAHLVLVPNPEHHPGGDFLLRDGRIVAAGAGARLTFAGISILSPALFDAAEPGRFPLAPLLRAAAGRGQASGELHAGRWTDVGTPERLRQLDAGLSLKGTPPFEA